MHIVRVLAVAALAAALAAPAARAAHILDNGRIHMEIADTSTGLTGTNNDRVDSIEWTGSTGVSTGNLASNGGPLHCADPQEFFGQAYGDSGNATPYFVIAGDKAKWAAGTKPKLSGTSSETSLMPCDLPLDGTTKTKYSLSTAAGTINQFMVARTFTFATTEQSDTLRAYVPRLPFARYEFVLIPNAAGVVQRVDSGGCAGNCEVTDWNHAWFAFDDGNGGGLLVLRDAAKGPSAVVVVDNDSYSSSDNTSVGLKQPPGGWSGAVMETEALCFYDAKSWSPARQASGLLPIGCRAP